MKLSRHLLLFLVLSVGFAAFQIGCWQKNGKNPVAALPDSTLASSVAFKIVTPANQNASFSASIRSSSENQPFVTFELKLANFGNSLTPFSLVKKQAPVVNGSVTVTFESLPNTTVVGSLQIENGNINGFSNFHGAADLNQGPNVVELAPVGSLMPQDVLANAVSEIVSSSTLLLKAPTALATELAKIVSNLPLDSTSVYDEVLNNFSNRAGLPLVELLAPANAQTFTIGSSINIIASATDLDGNISKVEFYKNSTKIGEKSSLPFSLEWQPSATGTYSVYAKAIDNNAAVGVSASITVFVVDSAPTHTVTYNSNGNTSGSVPTDDQFYQSGATVTVSDNTGSLTKTGYTFAGWNTAADGSGTSYNPAATFTMGAANVTLYAKWSLAPTYTVTYNGNGNTGGTLPTDNQIYQQNATVTVADNTGNLTKTGYTFAGWNTAADGSGANYNAAATFNMGATNVTLYAKWSLVPTYTVTYNGNGNTGGTVPTDDQTYQQNATVTVADNTGNLTKTGYTFAGWNTAADGSGTSYLSLGSFVIGNESIVLYTQWKREIILTSIPNDQYTTLSWLDIGDNATYDLFYSLSPNFSLETATKLTNVTSPYKHASLTNGKVYYYVLVAKLTQEEILSEEIFSMPNPFDGGDGSETNPFLVATAYQLHCIRDFAEKNFILTEDIDLNPTQLIGQEWYDTDKGWLPIGHLVALPFKGVVDGNNHIISNLCVTRQDNDKVGLFATNEGKISRIRLHNVNIKGKNFVGALVAYNLADVSDSHVDGKVDGNASVGGGIGSNYGVVKDCSSDVTITGSFDRVGGLAGENHKSIENGFSLGKVTGNSWHTGGLVGENTDIIFNSCSEGDVIGRDSVGGLIGTSKGQILRCKASGNVTGSNVHCGGLIGYSYGGEITSSFSNGLVIGVQNVGGLIGFNEAATIKQCYSTGIASGELRIGGAVGWNKSIFINCFCIGEVIGNVEDGGFVGLNDEGSISGCYWDLTASKKVASDGGIGKTTEELKQESTYIGWDFLNIWGIEALKNNGYPYLK